MSTAYNPDDPRHGKRSFYIHGGCRCDECRAVATAYNRERMRRIRPTEPAKANPAGSLRMTAPFAVYAYFAPSGTALYVGQTSNMRNRHREHRKNSPWFADAAFMAIIADAETRDQAIAREGRKIAELRPIHNKNGTDHARGERAA